MGFDRAFAGARRDRVIFDLLFNFLRVADFVDNPVETNVVATYFVTFSVQDSAGNMAQVQRLVIVQAQRSGGGGTLGLMDLLALLILGSIANARPGRFVNSIPVRCP